mmetsp:Transcript_4596/g.5196  ORF Transcript_4596/g.5196 Transcript_4596/m.5196 type:complete len:276 (+) Transcript_4596:103-930(+)
MLNINMLTPGLQVMSFPSNNGAENPYAYNIVQANYEAMRNFITQDEFNRVMTEITRLRQPVTQMQKRIAKYVKVFVIFMVIFAIVMAITIPLSISSGSFTLIWVMPLLMAALTVSFVVMLVPKTKKLQGLQRVYDSQVNQYLQNENSTTFLQRGCVLAHRVTTELVNTSDGVRTVRRSFIDVTTSLGTDNNLAAMQSQRFPMNVNTQFGGGGVNMYNGQGGVQYGNNPGMYGQYGQQQQQGGFQGGQMGIPTENATVYSNQPQGYGGKTDVNNQL